MRTQIAFRKQLFVRFDDNTPRHIEIGRKRSCRRQKCARLESTGLDRTAQFALQLHAHRHTALRSIRRRSSVGEVVLFILVHLDLLNGTTKLYSMPMMPNESTMPKVAFATCRELPQLDADTRRLIAPLAARGVLATPAVWDDPDIDWACFDPRRRALVLGLCTTPARVPRMGSPSSAFG